MIWVGPGSGGAARLVVEVGVPTRSGETIACWEVWAEAKPRKTKIAFNKRTVFLILLTKSCDYNGTNRFHLAARKSH